LWVARLELVDFRSYRSAELDLPRGTTVLVGPNGRGKTNILEALHRVAVGSSHRISGDSALVREGAQEALVRTRIVTDEGRARTVDLQVGGGRTRAKVDGQPVRRSADACGVLTVVAFAPEDLSLVRGDPSDRRRFLDQLLTQRRPSYGAALSEFDRVLRQRNALLRDLRGGAMRERGLLETFTGQLIAHGAPIVTARLAALARLAGPVADVHARLTGSDVSLSLTHRADDELDELVTASAEPDVTMVAQAMQAALARRAEEEARRGVSLVGPHRDDVAITLDGLPARTTASQGEAWSVALACKVGATPILTEVGDRPVLLLDDVFSELDERRRARVVELCDGFDQVLVTAAVDADVPLDGPRIDVRRDDDGRSGPGSTLHPRNPRTPDGPAGASASEQP
jgi:DNA replication and repair protein RecF